MYGADFNDRLTGLAADGALLCLAEPGRTLPRPEGTDVSALVQCLRERMPEAAGGLWVAVPPLADGAGLGESLRQLRAAGFAVQGFVDRAAVLVAWLRRTGACAVLDLSRSELSISMVLNEGAAVVLRRTVRLPGGEAALHAAWLNLAAVTLVQQTRFDPLHERRSEEQLRQRLPGLATAAQRDGQGSCTIDAGSSELTLTLTRDQLVAAASAWLQPLAAALQSLSAATPDCTLLVPESLLDIPGVAELLANARFGATLRVTDGMAASAASLMAAAAVAPSGAVQYLTRVPAFALPGEPPALEVLALQQDAALVMATHLVYRGRALAIPAEGLVIGRDPGDGNVLRLPEGAAGLSRRHCTLRRDAQRTYIVDHSTYGTYLDGNRVRGRALLAAGSTLQLGDPGIELPLVALGAAPAPAA